MKYTLLNNLLILTLKQTKVNIQICYNYYILDISHLCDDTE